MCWPEIIAIIRAGFKQCDQSLILWHLLRWMVAGVWLLLFSEGAAEAEARVRKMATRDIAAVSAAEAEDKKTHHPPPHHPTSKPPTFQLRLFTPPALLALRPAKTPFRDQRNRPHRQPQQSRNHTCVTSCSPADGFQNEHPPPSAAASSSPHIS